MVRQFTAIVMPRLIYDTDICFIRHEDNGKGYVPLQWSSALKEDAFAWAQYLVDTNQFKHDKGPFGENIAMNSGSVKQRTTEDILSRECLPLCIFY